MPPPARGCPTIGRAGVAGIYYYSIIYPYIYSYQMDGTGGYDMVLINPLIRMILMSI